VRVLVVASTYPLHADDGTPAFVRDLARGVSKQAEVLVLAPSIHGAGSEHAPEDLPVQRFRSFPARWEDLADGAILENLRAKPSRWLQVTPFFVAEVLAMRRAVAQFDPDVVHLHWLIPQGLAALVGAAGRPTVVTTLGGDLYALQDPVSRFLKRLVVRRATRLTAMNGDMRARLLELGGSPSTTFVMPMAGNLDVVRSAGASIAPLSGRIAFVGRLVEKKGLHVLLDALGQLPAASWSLDIVGDGPLRTRLEQQAHGLPARFLGQLSKPELARILAAAEIHVFPSVRGAGGDQDGLPVALIEGMAIGRAVVVSDLPGLATTVRDGVDGIVVPAGDASSLGRAIAELLADPDRRERLAASARARADAFGIEAVAARYTEVLRDAAAPHAVGRRGRRRDTRQSGPRGSAH
jgi:colanic acid/amylovoran biosynthesis glycosyltransferase